VPTFSLYGDTDGVTPWDESEQHHRFFTGNYAHRVISGVGHNLPQEAPRDFAAAILSLI
jgi:pimeloyl-ACP methyl ester carboxylesterase